MSYTQATVIYLSAGQSISDHAGIPPGQTRGTFEVDKGTFEVLLLQGYLEFDFVGQCSSGTLGYSGYSQGDVIETYAGNTAYTTGDILKSNIAGDTNLYICLEDFTSDAGGDFSVDLANGYFGYLGKGEGFTETFNILVDSCKYTFNDPVLLTRKS